MKAVAAILRWFGVGKPLDLVVVPNERLLATARDLAVGRSMTLEDAALAIDPHLHERQRAEFELAFLDNPRTADCTHDDAAGIDDLQHADPLKVYRCHGCGLTFRYVLVPGKPWWFKGRDPVQVIS